MLFFCYLYHAYIIQYVPFVTCQLPHVWHRGPILKESVYHASLGPAAHTNLGFAPYRNSVRRSRTYLGMLAGYFLRKALQCQNKVEDDICHKWCITECTC